MAKQVEQEKKPCKECKKELVKKSNFYASNSFMHPDGYVDICKKCVSEMVNIEDLNSVYMVLQSLDKPFLYDAWEKAKNSKSNRNPLGLYIGTVNMVQHQNKTWKDSVFAPADKFSPQINSDNLTSTEPQRKNNFKVTDDIVDKWGFGFSPEEYQAFERKYERLRRSYDEKTEMHSEALRTYITYKVRAELETAKGNEKGAKEWGSLAQKAAQDAKLNPNQMSKSDISGGIDGFAQLFEAVESEIGIIPILPRLLEQPYDDADMIIWSTINYARKLEEKPRVAYRDIYIFYDQMLEEYYKTKNYSTDEIDEYKTRRNNVFRDMEEVFKEPLYEEVEVESE